jgi:DNA-binding NarL/FixJ family response regulator
MLRVLIVDDSALLRKRLAARIAEEPGVEIVGEAADVPQAVSKAAELAPDVVVLDIRMPGGSGIDVLSEVKKFTPPPIVIILTSFPYAELRSRCTDLGADFIFDKTSEFEKVPETIRALVFA